MHAASCQAYRPASWDAAAASRAAAKADAADRPGRCERRHGHAEEGIERAQHTERRHPLVAALNEALRSLMPADGADGPDSRALEDSARAFAHELVDALRESGGHHHGMHGARRGYDDLASRLERLAGTLDQPAPTNTASSASLRASLTTASLTLSVDENGTNASLSVTAVELNVSAQSTVSASNESPLLAAFHRLMSALQPDAAPAASGAAADAGTLPAFLRQLASALRGGGTPADAAPSGSLVSLAA